MNEIGNKGNTFESYKGAKSVKSGSAVLVLGAVLRSL